MTTAVTPPDIDVTRGMICPHCGCRKLLAEKTRHTETATERSRVCADCGHRVFTSEQIDRPEGGPAHCPICGCRKLLSANVHHRIDHTLRYRRCRSCKTRVRTREVVLDRHPPYEWKFAPTTRHVSGQRPPPSSQRPPRTG